MDAHIGGRHLSSLAVAISVAVAALSGCGDRPRLGDGSLTLTAGDGIRLAAHYYRPVGESPPGLILVHGTGGDRHVWEAFAVRAQQGGYLVVSLDLRGHGESREGPSGALDFRNFGEADWQAMQLDIDAAFRQLLALGANPKDLFIAGEGAGANLALQYAVEHRDIQGVVLLSAGAAYHGIPSAPLIDRLTTRPALLVWCERDDYGASSGAALEGRAPGHVEARVYPGSAHGAAIFATSPEAMGQVLVWLAQMREKPAFGAS